MEELKWLEVVLDTTQDKLDDLCARLTANGVTGMAIEDEADFKTFLEQNRQYWDYVDEGLEQSMAGKCRITFYLEDSEAGYRTLAMTRIALQPFKEAHPAFGSLLLTMENVEDADWENNWKAFYKPMEIGERLIVIPDWEEADPHGRVALRLNPGLIFGTGSHATTRLCLQALERLVQPGMRVLDLGCGSGILSIAALLLGADSAFGCDIDDKAVDVAYENAALNGIGKDRYTVRAGDVLSDRKLRADMGAGYDIVVANIVADVIIALAATVRDLMAPDGYFLCSGIIDDRAAEVKGKLVENGFTVLEENSSEGWYSYLCQ